MPRSFATFLAKGLANTLPPAPVEDENTAGGGCDGVTVGGGGEGGGGEEVGGGGGGASATGSGVACRVFGTKLSRAHQTAH